MLKSLKSISVLEKGDMHVLKTEKWLMYLYLTKEKKLNIERVHAVKDINEGSILQYVKNQLDILQGMNISTFDKELLEEVIIWSESAKCGLPNIRQKWIENRYNLFIHNVGSSEIYMENKSKANTKNLEDLTRTKIINTLISTHGLIGQFIRGEVNLSENIPLTLLITNKIIKKEKLEILLEILNECIIKAVSIRLWDEVKNEVYDAINAVINNKYDKEYTLKERLRKLRQSAIKKGEDFDKDYDEILNKYNFENLFNYIFSNSYLWYVESALSEFSFDEFIKIFTIICSKTNILKIKHISFEQLMRDIYYDYNDKKTINVYKKRIIEKYLSEISYKDLIQGIIKGNEHVSAEIFTIDGVEDTLSFTFKFSNAAEKLIAFCTEAAKTSSPAYDRAVVLLYDLFNFRHDGYDRLNNEDSYLNTMNSTINLKAPILDYIVGKSIVDIGPGGGALMDLICERYPDKKVYGVDISSNVIENLNKQIILQKKPWNVMQGDALNLDKTFNPGSVDTVILCSIIHELYSYIPTDGKKFNYNTIKQALINIFKVLPSKGRIIIRDGIMTSPANQKRIIRFKDKKDIEFVKRYAEDFKGRTIAYEIISEDTVIMPVNDSMEMLYTYTWGEESYAHEIQEQFGYFAPEEYKHFIEDTLGEQATIIEFKDYLQEGYEEHLMEKIEFFDEQMHPVKLPNSTCLIVIEKK